MRYQGSKARIAKHIIPFIAEHLNDDRWYVEPFMGGCNMFSKVDHPKKIGCDYNRYVVDMWNAFKDGKEPPTQVSEEEYLRLKELSSSGAGLEDETQSWLIGYVGNACSYGSSWFNGYARYNPKKREDHILEAYNGTMRQIREFKHLSTSKFLYGDYESINYPENSVIYCDPPYQSTKRYMGGDFDHVRFWEWARKMSRKGHIVLVSEYTAPDDFKCIWSMDRADGMPMSHGKQGKKTEKLFVYSGT